MVIDGDTLLSRCKKALNHLLGLSCIPESLSLHKGVPCDMLSKALCCVVLVHTIYAVTKAVCKTLQGEGGVIPFTSEILTHICSCHNFSTFLLCRYFYYQPVAYCVCFRMICKKSLLAPFLRRYIQTCKSYSKNCTSQMATRLIPRRHELPPPNSCVLAC